MRNTHLWIFLGSLAGGALLWPGAVRGQDFDAATMLYGQGVHAYFAGNCPQAESYLSSALEMNSQDPRTYYFRALCLLRLGRTAEARGDMMTGAALEAQRPNRWGIGAALERVQGYDRLLLEQFRRQARLEAALNGGPSGGQAITGRQPEVLRERVVIPLDEYLRPGVPQPTARGAVDATVPRTFAPTDGQPPAAGNRTAPAETPDDPFRDDPQAPARRAPVVPPPPTSFQPSAPAPTDSEDPFGGAATEAAPQGPATPPAPAAEPVDAPTGSDDEDPFRTP
jgi:hypothetical protein